MAARRRPAKAAFKSERGACAEDAKKNGYVHLKLFVIGDYVALSECLPVFENLGLKVIAEDAFPLAPLDGKGETIRVSLQNFLMERAEAAPSSAAGVGE